MNVRTYIGCLLFACMLALAASAQTSSNFRTKKIAVSPSPVVFDENSIVPGTFKMQGFDAKWFVVDEPAATIRWLQLPATDSVLIQYRVFPFSLARKAYRYQYDSISNYFKALPPAKGPTSNGAGAGKIADFGNLTYTGSFGRSLSFGNAQDAVVNSLFNLQISGMLGDSIEIAAAITDNNIPIQPDGTTQQLNEFDRVWMQFKKRGWALSIGDIDVRQQPTYFMSYYKRQQGIAFETVNKVGKNSTNKTFVSGAVAKGKFTRNVFNGIEGNQGPYRLRGANNELYFVILAGTERVFIDGKQMQRGEDQDYVINYNSAEITFTPHQLINKDKRIQVEFEYADRNYLNSLLYLANSFEINKKLTVDVGLYSNADSKNSPINQTLDTKQRQFLSEIGDSLQYAYYPVETRDSFNANKILYVKVDTVVGASVYKIYRYKSSYDTAMYTLSFTDVGQGNGNYIPLMNAANGKVYQWIAPVAGKPQGNYDPVAYLVTPKKQQMVTAAVAYKFSKHTSAKMDAAYSYTDVNTYSAKDKEDNGGAGIKLLVNDKREFGPASNKRVLQSEGRYESVAETFRPLERLRTVEFLRDWGLPFDVGYAKEQLPGFSIALSDAKNQQFSYDFSAYLRSDEYSGKRHTIAHAAQFYGFQLSDGFQYTHFNGSTYDGRFLRPNISMSKTLKQLGNHEIGGSFAMEYNEIKSTVADTLLPSSFSFKDWKAYIRSNASKPNRWSFNWFRRANDYPLAAGFVPLDVNNNFNLQVEMFKSLHHQFRLNSGYRMLEVKTTGITSQQSDKTLLGRAEYLLNIGKGAIVGNALYEVGAGQEQQRDYSYVEVPAGRGEYAWFDYNGDGVPQLNEFETAQFPDQAKYIRIFTPTNRFVKSTYTTFNYSLIFSPANAWRRDSAAFRKFLSKWNAQSSLQTTNKKLDDGSFHFNPFEGTVADTNLLYLSTNIANTLSFNRYSTKWGFDLSQVRNSIKAILTYGYETHLLNDYSLRIRKNAGRNFTFLVSGKMGTNELITPNPKFDNRNYEVSYYGISPSVTYTKGATFRSQLAYKWDDKKATTNATPQTSTLNTLLWETKYNLVQSGLITTKLTYSNISFDGAKNTTVSYIMLDGLQPGKNFLWNIDFTKRLANALELSFQYEGRKAGDTRTVHIGRAALRAIL